MFRVVMLILTGAALLDAQITVSTKRIAGLPTADWPIGDGGPATNALLNPSALAWDRSGNLLIADARSQRIRRLTPGGAISTVIDHAGVIGSLAVDSKGNIYASVFPSSVSDHAHIFEFSANGGKTEIASPGSMDVIPGIAMDAADNLYITDQSAMGGGFVWKRSPSGAVQKVAGKSVIGGLPTQGGPALEVPLGGPHALAFDHSGNLLIADWSGILRLNPDGTLIRLVQGWWPTKITPAADGSIYFIGYYYGISRWSPLNGVSSFAGTQQQGFSDGCAFSGGKRVAKYASINAYDLTVDAAGRVYVADNNNDPYDPASIYSNGAGRIRRIDPDGSIITVAGSGSMPRESAPGGPALQAILHVPEALAVDGAGNVFFAEPSANRVQEITAAGLFVTVAGTDSPPPGEDGACYTPTGKDVLLAPRGIAVDADGNLYISDTGHHRILRRSRDGAITTIAGTGTQGQTGDGGPAIDAQISAPTSIAIKPDGSIYFVTGTDFKLHRIRRDGIVESPPAPQGIGSVLVGFDGRLILSGSALYRETAVGAFYPLLNDAYLTAADSAGAIYGPSTGGLLRVSTNCNVATVSLAEGPRGRGGPANDPLGNLFFSADNSIWRIPAITPPTADAPSPSLDGLGVFNAASNLTAVVSVVTSPNPLHPPILHQVNDSIAGNEILRIKGGCMGPLMPSQASLAAGTLPTSLLGTRVLFDGVAASLLKVQATEILAITPRNVTSKSKVTMVVEYQGSTTSAALKVEAAVPGVFVSTGTQAAATNEDGSLNGPDHPASVGSIVSLFLTGAGVMDPPVEDGVPPSPPLPQLVLPVTVKVGGLPAEVTYAGAAPGFPGLVQVNVRIPSAAASNVVPVQVSIGGISRTQAVTLSVQY